MQDGGHVRTAGVRDEAQMSNYVADKVRANRAGIKNLFQNPDGSSICGEPWQDERALEMPGHMTVVTGTQRTKTTPKNYKSFLFSEPSLSSGGRVNDFPSLQGTTKLCFYELKNEIKKKKF